MTFTNQRYGETPYAACGNSQHEGGYMLPPCNRQRYSSGTNAYTFVSVGNIITNFLDAEFMLNDNLQNNESGIQFTANVGAGFIGIEHLYGWDRYGGLELESKDYDLYPGINIGAAMSMAVSFDKVTWFSKILGVDVRIGFTDGAPVIMFELIFGGPLSNNSFYFLK